MLQVITSMYNILMKIYVLADKKTYDAIKVKINQTYIGEIFHFEEKDISKIPQLFTDSEEKILAIEPTVINWSLPTDAISRISNLLGICTSSAWARYIDFDYCRNNSISITKTIGANSQSVAEYGIWMMYCLARRLPMQLQKNDESNYHTELFGKTVGIIGLGNIGSRIAEIANGIGMRVQYWNRSQKESPYPSVNLEHLIQSSDVIINSVEICADTQGLLGKSLLSKMKPSAFFISVLGGMGWGVQDDQVLIDMVQSNAIAGFAVENEHKGSWNESYPGNIFIPIARAHHTKEAEERVMDQWIEGIISVITNTKSPFKVI